MATDTEIIKKVCREADYPFFSEEDLAFYLEQNDGVVSKTIYQCLLIKAENTALQVTGLSTMDMSKYFLRLARKYKPSNTGTLSGGN